MEVLSTGRMSFGSVAKPTVSSSIDCTLMCDFYEEELNHIVVLRFIWSPIVCVCVCSLFLYTCVLYSMDRRGLIANKMNEWMNDCMSEWVSEWVSEWMNEWILLCVNITPCVWTWNQTRMTFSRAHIQWLKWSCEAGAHLTKPGWSKPHTHSTSN